MSFTFSEYGRELAAVGKGLRPDTLVRRVAYRSFLRPSLTDVMEEKRAEGGAELKRTLKGLDLLMFGVDQSLSRGLMHSLKAHPRHLPAWDLVGRCVLLQKGAAVLHWSICQHSHSTD